MFNFSKSDNVTVTLPSGKQLNITLAPMIEVMPLYRSVVSEFKKSGISLDLSGLMDIELKDGKLKINDLFPLISKNLSGFVNGFLDVAISPDVLNNAMVCAKRCILDKQRINPELFDNIEYREDFFPAISAIIYENMRPFFPRLHTLLNQIKENIKEPK